MPYLDVRKEGGLLHIVQTRTGGGRGAKIPRFLRTHLMEAPLSLPVPVCYIALTIVLSLLSRGNVCIFVFAKFFLFEPCALPVKSFIFPIKIKPRQWALSIPSSQRNLQRPSECSASEHCKLRPTRACAVGRSDLLLYKSDVALALISLYP